MATKPGKPGGKDSPARAGHGARTPDFRQISAGVYANSGLTLCPTHRVNAPFRSSSVNTDGLNPATHAWFRRTALRRARIVRMAAGDDLIAIERRPRAAWWRQRKTNTTPTGHGQIPLLAHMTGGCAGNRPLSAPSRISPFGPVADRQVQGSDARLADVHRAQKAMAVSDSILPSRGLSRVPETLLARNPTGTSPSLRRVARSTSNALIWWIGLGGLWARKPRVEPLGITNQAPTYAV